MKSKEKSIEVYLEESLDKSLEASLEKSTKESLGKFLEESLYNLFREIRQVILEKKKKSGAVLHVSYMPSFACSSICNGESHSALIVFVNGYS